MNTKLLTLPAAALLGLSSLSAQAIPTPALFYYDINVDGVSSPAGVDLSLFNTGTGLGTITASISGVGSHTLDAYFDHDIGGSFSNEAGKARRTAASGQSWEIDKISGNIWSNFLNSDLDNTNSVVFPTIGDVAMAMGWDFDLLSNQEAEISFLLSTEKPDEGFYLKQENIVGGNPNYLRSNYDIYLSSTLRVVPEPSMLLLLGIGLTGMVITRRKMKV